MERRCEPELMEGEAQAAVYAAANFSEPNQRFCGELAERGLLPRQGRLVDLGCGPADIPLRLARAHPGLRLDAVDGSAAMLAHARQAVSAAGLASRITLHLATLPTPLPDAAFDGAISNSLLHHLHRPEQLWNEVARLARPGAGVLVMDLRRPRDEAEVDALVAQHAAGEPALLQRDFRASLRAAFTPEEVQRQLAAAGLGGLSVQVLGDRHLLVSGRR